MMNEKRMRERTNEREPAKRINTPMLNLGEIRPIPAAHFGMAWRN